MELSISCACTGAAIKAVAAIKRARRGLLVVIWVVFFVMFLVMLNFLLSVKFKLKFDMHKNFCRSRAKAGRHLNGRCLGLNHSLKTDKLQITTNN